MNKNSVKRKTKEVNSTEATFEYEFGESSKDNTATFDENVNDGIFYLVALLSFLYTLSSAYRIRVLAIKEYGPVIHEFDPYFNYRATEVR